MPQARLFCLFLFCTLALAPLSSARADGTFIWLDDIDYFPFVHQTDGKPAGMFVDVVREIFQRTGRKMEVRLYPWKRTQVLVRAGKGHGMMTAITPERMRFLDASDSVFTFQWRPVVNRTNPKAAELLAITNREQLKGHRIVTYLGNGWAEENFRGLLLVRAPSFSQALLMLLRTPGRVDVMIEHDILVARTVAQSVRDGNLTEDEAQLLAFGEKSYSGVDFHFLVRKDYPDKSFLPAFNAALAAMRKDGSYQRIWQAYTN